MQVDKEESYKLDDLDGLAFPCRQGGAGVEGGLATLVCALDLLSGRWPSQIRWIRWPRKRAKILLDEFRLK